MALRLLSGIAAIAIAGVALLVSRGLSDSPDATNSSTMNTVRPTHPTRIPLGILGDSDSHSFHDSLAFAAMPEARGGRYRASTFNWPEMLHKLRSDQIDLGPWGIWGNSRERYAVIREAFGLPARLPRKQDYRYNFAVSGATCDQLMHGRYRQASRLLAVMDQEPERWRNGVVLIRIGVNSFGNAKSLERLARDPHSPEVGATIRDCTASYQQAVELIRAHHPQTRFVLVGIFDNAQWAKLIDQWQSPTPLHNIFTGLQQFDSALRDLVATDPSHLAFFDDQAWFQKLWGSRDENGKPAYTDVLIDGRFRVSNTVGDTPSNATLQDGHAGTAWNGLWAKSLVELLNDRFSLGLRPITEAEILQLIKPAGADTEPASENLEDSQSSTRANR